MKASFAAIGAFLSLVHQSTANLDVITLPANGNTWIQEAVATLVLGDVPNPITGDIALWSAIMMDEGDFLQGVTQNSPGRYEHNPVAFNSWTGLLIASTALGARTWARTGATSPTLSRDRLSPTEPLLRLFLETVSRLTVRLHKILGG